MMHLSFGFIEIFVKLVILHVKDIFLPWRYKVKSIPVLSLLQIIFQKRFALQSISYSVLFHMQEVDMICNFYLNIYEKTHFQISTCRRYNNLNSTLSYSYWKMFRNPCKMHDLSYFFFLQECALNRNEKTYVLAYHQKLFFYYKVTFI